MSTTRTKNLIKDTLWLTLGSFGSRILSFFLIPIYADTLLTSELGTIDIITTTLNCLLPLLTLSIQDAAFRFPMEYPNDHKSVFSISFSIAIASGLLMIVIAPIINKLLPIVREYSKLYCLVFLGNSLVAVCSFFIKGEDKSLLFAIQGIIYTFVFTLSNILFLKFLKLGIKGYLISIIIANGVSLLFMFVAGRMYLLLSFKSIKSNVFSQMVRYSIPLIPASIAWWVMSSIDKYMLLYMCDENANGLHTIASKIPAIITVITSIFINAWQISAIKYVDDDSDYSSKLFMVLISIGSFIGCILIMSSNIIGKVLFLNDYYPAWEMMPSLCVSAIISTLAGFIGAQFTAQKRTDLHLKSNILAMVLNVVFNYIFIKKIGINGAAIGTMCSYFIVFLYRYYLLKKLMIFNISNIKVFVSLALLSFSAIVPCVIRKMFYVSTVISSLIIIFLFKEYYKNLCVFIVGKIKKKVL